MAVARFMLDTNILLQCRDLPELPWEEVTDAEEVELYPAPTALFEIDRFKTSSDRKADRARLVFRRMRQAAIDPSQQHQLRTRGPRLFLRIAPHLSGEEEQRVFALPSPDYRIVEEARILAAQLADLCLITNDTGPFLRAQRLGCKVQLVDAHWLLPRESSGTERRLAAVERRLEAITNGGPVIEVQLSTVGRADPQALPITEYGQLSPFSRDQLLEILTGEKLIAAEERLQRRLRGRDDSIVIISPYAPEDYLRDVKAWREEVRTALEHASPHAQIASRLHPFQIVIANKGARPAEHVKVKVEASGHVILASVAASARYWDADENYLVDARLGAPRLEIPPPPSSGNEEEGEQASAPPRMGDDRYAFRRTSRDDGDHAEDAIVFECQDLRHGGEEHTLYFAAFVGGAAHDGELKTTITAANLPEPVTMTTPLKCVESRADIDGVVANMVRLYTSGVRLNRRRSR